MQKELITTEEQLEKLVHELRKQTIFCYDTETNGQFDRFKVQLVGLSLAFGDDYCCYIPLMHEEGDQLFLPNVLAELRVFFEDEDIEKVCHNAKFDEMVLFQHGIDVRGPGHDTFVMAWLLAEDRGAKRGLKPLVKEHLGVEMETYEDVIASAPKKRGIDRDYNFARVGLSEALSYAADDAYYTLKLYWFFKRELEKQKLWLPYDRVERPFTRVLRVIEERGVFIDMDALDYADKRLPEIAGQVESDIYAAAGEVFQIRSPKQLGDILFGKLGIGTNVPKTKTGNFKTDKHVLDYYKSKHQIVRDVLRRKKIQKTHSTFVTGTKNAITKDGKLHPSFNGSGTITGRLSCSKPNLQQVEGDEVEEIKVRNFFIPSEGNRFIVVDYGQIELRLMAHFSKDERMIAAFLSGRDFHEETARGMLKVPDSREVLPRERFNAKGLNFGVGYGRGPDSISKALDITFEDAADFIDKWWANFPQLADYKVHLLREARKNQYIRTLSGRKRRLPDVLNNNTKIRKAAERQAFNTKFQGSAADIIKMAMISLKPVLAENNCHMCIQIHDELVIEAPTATVEEMVPPIKHIMENPLNGRNPIRLPLIADPKIVDRWGDGK